MGNSFERDIIKCSLDVKESVSKTYPFLAILRSMVCAILCNAVSVEVPLLKPNCFLLRLSAML